MPSKREVLERLRVGDLRTALDAFGLEVDDRRVKQQAIDALARSRRATTDEILALLSMVGLRTLCRDLGLESKGRTKADLVSRVVSPPRAGATPTEEEPDGGAALGEVQAKADGPDNPKQVVTNYLDSLVTRIQDGTLREEIARGVSRLRDRKDFGLVFERHLPEMVRLFDHEVRPGIKVQEREHPAGDLWTVTSVEGETASLLRVADSGREERKASLAELVVVREFGQPIYPGLTPVGRIERGKDKPFHSIIQAENYHALETLLYAYEGRVDCIYIDPPYNTGARDWKYNNNYVDALDSFRHSKWLSFMEKRLRLARRLLNPQDSVLLVTIDTNECYTLGLLLEKLFPACEKQMVSITISPRGKSRDGRLSQVDEYLMVVYLGASSTAMLEGQGEDAEIRWRGLRRTDIESKRGTKKGGPRQFYPIYVDEKSKRIVKIGDSLAEDESVASAPHVPGAVAVFPIRKDGVEMNWSLVGESLKRALDQGYVRVTGGGHDAQPYTFAYLTHPVIKKIESGVYRIQDVRADGSKVVVVPGGKVTRPTTAWREKRHDAGAYGTSLLGALIPGRKFPFPKSLYAVEDTLRLFVRSKPNAVILDFFAGSGTTAHAVARLNRQDGGRRHSLLITNNEVAEEEAKTLRQRGVQPGDPKWEALGIFQYITMPRIQAAVMGKTADGEEVKGAYRFVDEFSMAEGFDENVEFARLDYLDRDAVDLGRAFEAVAPLLWLKAGATGPRIDRIEASWALPDGASYGILFDAQRWTEFVHAVRARQGECRCAFVVTNSTSVFQQVVADFPAEVQPFMLYEDYLTNFAINVGGRP